MGLDWGYLTPLGWSNSFRLRLLMLLEVANGLILFGCLEVGLVISNVSGLMQRCHKRLTLA